MRVGAQVCNAFCRSKHAKIPCMLHFAGLGQIGVRAVSASMKTFFAAQVEICIMYSCNDTLLSFEFLLTLHRWLWLAGASRATILLPRSRPLPFLHMQCNMGIVSMLLAFWIAAAAVPAAMSQPRSYSATRTEADVFAGAFGRNLAAYTSGNPTQGAQGLRAALNGFISLQ